MLEQNETILAVSFVVDVACRKYIDPVATVSSRKRQGVARVAVNGSLRSLDQHGERQVGAVITEGKVASERLFACLGFVRVGAWGVGDELARMARAAQRRPASQVAESGARSAELASRQRRRRQPPPQSKNRG